MIERGGTKYINEFHPGGGNPILAISENTETIFTDLLVTSLGFLKDEKYLEITKTSFDTNTSNRSLFRSAKYY